MKILLFGANGQVGIELRRSLASIGTVIATTRSGALADGTPCEIADFDQPDALPSLIERIGPDIVVNAAGYTAVDRAEDDAEAAYRANAHAPAAIARACAGQDIALVHYSTDYVFDGTSARAYREDDATAPLGVYGASKLAGEEAIRSSGARHHILRTAWVYALHGHNFLRTMLRVGAERAHLRVVADQVGTPTPAWLLADTTAELLRAEVPPGTYHLAASGQTSWHAFAEAIFEEAQRTGLLSRIPTVEAIRTSEYLTRAHRPAWSVLDCNRLASALGTPLPAWRDALRTTLAASVTPSLAALHDTPRPR